MRSALFEHPCIERRFTPGIVELRAGENGSRNPIVGGYAAKFGRRSEDMGAGGVQYFEIIEAGFFDSVMRDDVRCLFNHDANKILGRTRAKTCRIFQDNIGLGYECDAEERQTYTRDLIISLRRGDVTQSSFAFKVKREGQRWVETKDTITRYLLKGGCSGLFDVSPVTYPAYPAATSNVREALTIVAAAAREGLLSRDAGESLSLAIKHRERQLQLAELSTR